MAVDADLAHQERPDTWLPWQLLRLLRDALERRERLWRPRLHDLPDQVAAEFGLGP